MGKSSFSRGVILLGFSMMVGIGLVLAFTDLGSSKGSGLIAWSIFGIGLVLSLIGGWYMFKPVKSS